MQKLPPITKVTLCSESEVKSKALKEVIGDFPWLENVELVFKDSQPEKNPVQPINSGRECSLRRIDHLGKALQTEDHLIIAIESDIQFKEAEGGNTCNDVCHVTIRRGDIVVSTESYPIPQPEEYYLKACKESDPEYANKEEGLSLTAGSIIARENPGVKANNWMADPKFGGMDRTHQIKDALVASLQKIYIAQNTAYHKDFPKPGVTFKDLSYVCADPLSFKYVVSTMKQAMVAKGWAGKVNKIMGFDARGFIFGSILARELDIGFIMIRKKGKLPGQKFQIKYTTEYSEEIFELVHDLVGPGDNVLLVDDVIATGGTFKAGVDAITMGDKGNVVGCLAVLQVDALVHVAREKLGKCELITLF